MFRRTPDCLSFAAALGAAAPALAALDGDNNPVQASTRQQAIGCGVFASAFDGAALPVRPGDNWNRCFQM